MSAPFAHRSLQAGPGRCLVVVFGKHGDGAKGPSCQTGKANAIVLSSLCQNALTIQISLLPKQHSYDFHMPFLSTLLP